MLAMDQNLLFLSETEIASRIAEAVRAYRLSPRGAHMTQQALAGKAGVSTGTIKRFQKTGIITLPNLIAVFRSLGLLQNLESLLPMVPEITPMEALRAEQRKRQPTRVRKPQSKG